MLHNDFITYKAAEITSELNDIEVVKQQYLAQLMLLKETLADCKELLHQKYNLSDIAIKDFFENKDGILNK